jgi:hypothetical protein
VLAVSAALLYVQARVPVLLLAAGGAFVALSLVALTALVERRRWAPALEAARWIAVLAAVTFSSL